MVVVRTNSIGRVVSLPLTGNGDTGDSDHSTWSLSSSPKGYIHWPFAASRKRGGGYVRGGTNNPVAEVLKFFIPNVLRTEQSWHRQAHIIHRSNLRAMLICMLARGVAFTIDKDSASSNTFPSALYHPFRPWPTSATDAASKVLVKDPIVDIQYHMGPVLTSAIRIYIIWYGAWKATQKSIIRDFLASISAPASVSGPSVRQWWSTVQTYTDQTGANISASIMVAGEHEDRNYSHGKLLSRLSVQEVIRSALSENRGTLPVNTKGGLYMVLTSEDVMMQDYCRAVCGFHYFTFPAKVGYTLPYAWIGNSGKSCPEVCAFPFAIPEFMGESFAPFKSPNDDIGVDGMVSVIGHELAEISSNPLINAWYAGEDPSAPFEIADLCEGMYGHGAGGGYPGDVPKSTVGASYNVHGVRGRKFLVQWLWNADMNSCQGPV